MGRINLSDFFQWFDPKNVNHLEAVDLLEQAMPETLLRDKSAWVLKYREPVPEPEIPDSPIPPQCLEIIAEFEGFRADPYLCPAGIPTIGYGNTFYTDGRKVSMSDPSITELEGLRLLEVTCEKDFWNVLKNTVPYWEEMNDNQRSALTSFGWNLGAHFYGSPGFNTISACLRDRAWDEVPGAFMLYVNPGSAFEAGLRRRREAEGHLWVS